MAGRLLGLLEPLSVAETVAAAHSDEAAAYAEESLRAVASGGALVAAVEADARLSGLEPASPEALATRLRGRPDYRAYPV